MSRENALKAFTHAHGWADANVMPLKQDASARRYFRLNKDGASCLLMDAPPLTEDIDAYLDITAYLRSVSLRVPEIYAEDRQQGFALIEDFGDATFTRLLNAGADEEQLYKLAVDALLQLHDNADSNRFTLPPYDMDALLREAALLVDWFLPAALGHILTEAEKSTIENAWRQVLEPVSHVRQTLVLRDNHIDNLMIVGEVMDIAHCGFLDYQDALVGSAAYDVMSLLEDARRDVSDATQARMLGHYIAARQEKIGPSFDAALFQRDRVLLAAQRHAKVAGIFTRLSNRDGKHHYLDHIPRVLRLLDKALSDPLLAPVQMAISQIIPHLTDVKIRRPA